jgi:hypothetical protein
VTDPWRGGSFDLSDQPTDGEIRRAVQVLKLGGAIGGNVMWAAAIARRLQGMGPDPAGGGDADAAYARVGKILGALAAPPNPAFASSRERRLEQLRGLGEGLTSRFRPHGRVGDVVPADASDDQIRALYAPGDAQVIIEFRAQLERLGRREAS